MCGSPAFQTQLARMRELAEAPEIGAQGIAYVDEQITKGLTCNQARILIAQLGGRIAQTRFKEEA
jgi:hypothetical protein